MVFQPENFKVANIDTKIYVGIYTTVHNLLLCAQTLCTNYVAEMFLLVSSQVRCKRV